MRLRPRSDDSSKLMLVSESLSSYLSYYCFKREVLISEMFVFYLSGCVLVLSGVELKQNVVAGT